MTTHLSTVEKQATLSLAGIYALRLFGLFMLVPVLSLYVVTLHNTTPFLIGIALGCYGLTQAVFQIPFGAFSDHYGRKRIIALGLLLFAAGSLIAATSHSIWGLIIGRSLQGASAIGSATTALLADLTTEEQRTKAMAVIGITIGVSFSGAMVLGPLLNGWFNVPILFWLTFLFALFALFILRQWVPDPQQKFIPAETTETWFSLLRNKKLLRLNMGILFLHAILTANFVVLPFLLERNIALNPKHLWYIYLPALLIALVIIAPMLRLTTKTQHLQKIYSITIGGLIVAELFLWQVQYSTLEFIFSLTLFFATFTLLEALIPSSIAKIAPAHHRGSAMGINATFQFSGVFMGGTFAGWLLGHGQMNSTLIICTLLAAAWFLIDILKLPE